MVYPIEEAKPLRTGSDLELGSEGKNDPESSHDGNNMPLGDFTSSGEWNRLGIFWIFMGVLLTTGLMVYGKAFGGQKDVVKRENRAVGVPEETKMDKNSTKQLMEESKDTSNNLLQKKEEKKMNESPETLAAHSGKAKDVSKSEMKHLVWAGGLATLAVGGAVLGTSTKDNGSKKKLQNVAGRQWGQTVAGTAAAIGSGIVAYRWKSNGGSQSQHDIQLVWLTENNLHWKYEVIPLSPSPLSEGEGKKIGFLKPSASTVLPSSGDVTKELLVDKVELLQTLNRWEDKNLNDRLVKVLSEAAHASSKKMNGISIENMIVESKKSIAIELKLVADLNGKDEAESFGFRSQRDAVTNPKAMFAAFLSKSGKNCLIVPTTRYKEHCHNIGSVSREAKSDPEYRELLGKILACGFTVATKLNSADLDVHTHGLDVPWFHLKVPVSGNKNQDELGKILSDSQLDIAETSPGSIDKSGNRYQVGFEKP